MLKKDNKREQMVYYQVTTDSETSHQSVRPTRACQAGIGTYTSSHALGFISAITRRFSKVLDQAIAWSLPLHTQCACVHEFFVRLETG